MKRKHFLIYIFSLSCLVASSQDEDTFKNKYLIVLDMQSDYIEGEFPDKVAHEFIDHVNKLISQVDSDKIVYVKTEMLVVSLSFKGISIDTIADLQFCENLNVVNTNIYIKEDGNAFSKDKLIDYFSEKSAKEIIIVGLLAEKCVTHTVKGGLELGYTIYIAPDAILSKNERVKAKTIGKLTERGAKLIAVNN